MENSITFKTVLSTRAQEEINNSWTWYEERLQGLGDRFVNLVIQRLQQIEKNPERYSLKHKNYREAIIEVFPYIIIYRINKKKKLVRIISVFHTSRNPKKKYKN